MQQADRFAVSKKEKTGKKPLLVPAVQCAVCAILVLSVFALSRSGSAFYVNLRELYAARMQEDYCADGVWTAAKRAARHVLEPIGETAETTGAVATIDERAAVETITSAGGEDIRVLDALQDSTFEAVSVSQEAVLPVQGKITSGFGYRIHPITGNRSFHTGVDLAAPEGTPIAAAYGGTVLETGCTSGRGNYILLSHGENLQTLYCHLSEIDVREGDAVDAGGTIGLVGTTGMSTGPHLHFELRVSGVRCNPLYVLKGLDYA